MIGPNLLLTKKNEGKKSHETISVNGQVKKINTVQRSVHEYPFKGIVARDCGGLLMVSMDR
jgi:hypothetical protein